MALHLEETIKLETQLYPSNLSLIDAARLPIIYERARYVLAECSRIDECKDWADTAEALASYAKQAKEESLNSYCPSKLTRDGSVVILSIALGKFYVSKSLL